MSLMSSPISRRGSTSRLPGSRLPTNEAASTEQDAAVDVDVLANGFDPTNDPLSVTAFDAARANGGTVDCPVAGICTCILRCAVSRVWAPLTTRCRMARRRLPRQLRSRVLRLLVPLSRDNLNMMPTAVCHLAVAHDTTTTAGANKLSGRGQELFDAGLLVNISSTTNVVTNGVTLTDQEILDVPACLDSY